MHMVRVGRGRGNEVHEVQDVCCAMHSIGFFTKCQQQQACRGVTRMSLVPCGVELLTAVSTLGGGAVLVGVMGAVVQALACWCDVSS